MSRSYQSYWSFKKERIIGEHGLSCRCNHPLCNPFSTLSSGVVVIVRVGNFILLGRHRLESICPVYTTDELGHKMYVLIPKTCKLGVCTGRLDRKDKGCHIACACRELREEFKLELTEQQFIEGLTHVEKFENVALYVYQNDSIDVNYLQGLVSLAFQMLPATSEYAELSALVMRDIEYFTTEESKIDIIPITRNTVNAVFNKTLRVYDRVLILGGGTKSPHVPPEDKYGKSLTAWDQSPPLRGDMSSPSPSLEKYELEESKKDYSPQKLSTTKWSVKQTKKIMCIK